MTPEQAEHNAVEAAEAFDAEFTRLIETALAAAEANDLPAVKTILLQLQRHWACDENTTVN